ncbi:TPA: hypothetical protein ACGD69_004639 [Serratia marcescens]|uniref:hypothetical protein n=1 Tax=Serratia marcescens TaxID=615 RepID=UPI00115360C3|nr:hypothetical protein FBF84_19265 [Serratia marcescens]QDI24912.1 hypothetical protein FBF90_19255 [Serratia marcescens]HEM7577165.1 hypothetical protein [Serratia marcescens]
MQTLKYAAMVEAMKAIDEPVIIVVGSFVGEVREVGARLAIDAGITPYYPSLSFSPSSAMMERKRKELISKGGKPVMFVDQYPLAVHWERGFKGFSLTDDAEEVAVAEIQAQNAYIRAASNKKERQRRCDEMMAKSLSQINNFFSASKEALIEIEQKAVELEASGNKEQQQAFLEELKEETFMQRVSRRIFGDKK